uniref:Pickpocket 27 n=1 Tax=Drosophila melanogaster TaxID=7227 RepID=Q9VZN1_DROME|nr:pickpocket 27 [Drosophila melanogaster]AAF47789.2 pickpocket 27 [Drosophila melanogaster]|eukprot:NP_647826.2 pickpocket 27 [Drosophila melanogaster]
MSRIVTAFNKTVVEYFRKTSLNGFGLLYFIRKRRIQRIFWFLFISFGILFASYAVFSMVLEFLSYSTIADLSELKVLEDEIHFPELKICSGYKFSYRNMLASAHDLVSSQNKSLDYWLNKLSLLSGYFDALSVKAENVDDLNSLLDIKNISSFLLALTPACESLILKCKLNNIPANCLKLFTLKAYNDGNCCVLRNSNLTGELTLFMDSSQIDEYPLNGNLPGFSLHVPSWQGRVSINPGEMAAVEIEVMELQGNSQLNEYAVEKRACYFSQEGESREKCLHECRIKATLINCQCVPYPFEFRTQKFGYCTLENIRCLQLVERNWSPAQCPQCLPLCNQLFYRLNKQILGHLHPWRSELNFKFKTPHRQRYKTNILYHWYQMLSNVGGVLGICIGCSFISGFELIYFLVFRLWTNYLRQPET